ncbi:Septin-9 [Microtus ochrogaster]|uniref:Septin-9 n=1 Tax=Microtus ochrogaster TaxID=79684 RepID=A0A8J6GX95_MICOH|nr:Septin-9 [Microtus ochrogaster]
MGLYWPRLHIGFSEEVEVPAVTKKDCGCCSHRDSKDSVGVLFQPSAWQKIRGFLCFRAVLSPPTSLPHTLGGSLFRGHKAPLILCSAPSHVTRWAGRSAPASRQPDFQLLGPLVISILVHPRFCTIYCVYQVAPITVTAELMKSREASVPCRTSHGDCDQVFVWKDFAAPSQALYQIQEETRDTGSEVAPSCVGDMADSPRDAMLKQAPVSRNEKAPVDFGYVGIDSILEQMRRKAMKQGFEFNIMVVGQSGLGKSTLINTLFKSKISRKSVQPTSEERIPKTIEIKSITHDIEEKGVRMKLTVIDTPGFGDHINNENCWQPIMKFINDQYEKYLQEEVNINRKKRIPDTRVHCCLYFIPATGHSLRPLDIEFMKRLSKVVNIVPVIAKADTLTLEERVYFKQRITADLLSNGIDVYPQKEFDEDSEDRLVNEKFREMIPPAVVGSDHEYQVNGKRILGRKTKWGTIEVENTTHCEFAYLRDLLIRTHMQNIKDITSSIHFEAYRVKRLNEGNSAMANGVEEKDPEAQEM